MSSITIKGPRFGVLELPETRAKAGLSKPELHDDRLVAALENNGARLAWSRCTICPCRNYNNETEQADPLHELCAGRGIIYFGPKDYVVPANAGELNDIQKAILAKDGAAVISGVLNRATQAQDFYDVLGNWVRGTMQVTVRSENKIGYYDRLVNLDAEVPYTEHVVIAAGVETIPLRYLATAVNAIFWEDSLGVLQRAEQGDDFWLDVGVPKWFSGRSPPANTRISVHYLLHPAWLVVAHPHVLRETKRRRKNKVANRTHPLGAPVQLPLQAAVRLEFVPKEDLPPPP